MDKSLEKLSEKLATYISNLIDRNLKPKKIKKTPKNGCLFNTACVP